MLYLFIWFAVHIAVASMVGGGVGSLLDQGFISIWIAVPLVGISGYQIGYHAATCLE